MRNKLDPSERRLEHIRAAVKAAGVKLTPQRLEIYGELAATEEHPDAEAIFRAVQSRMPSVSLDTVYRTLWRLHDLGLVTTLGPRREGVRFDANLGPHHHYVCTGCGLVRDFESAELNELRIPKTVKELGTVVDVQVQVRGLCSACRAKAPTRAASQKPPPTSNRKKRLGIPLADSQK